MRGVKILVAVMSLLIVIALGLLVYGFTRNTGIAVTGKNPLLFPLHSQIIQIVPWQKLLVFHVKTDGAEQLYFYDPAKNTLQPPTEIKYAAAP
jgi:hypothetical protein